MNATALGTEILKSLVLPGVGSFTILDPAPVSPQDAGSNFFLTGESVGQPRAEVAARLLLELNHEVRGETRQESVEQVKVWFVQLISSITVGAGDRPRLLFRLLAGGDCRAGGEVAAAAGPAVRRGQCAAAGR